MAFEFIIEKTKNFNFLSLLTENMAYGIYDNFSLEVGKYGVNTVIYNLNKIGRGIDLVNQEKEVKILIHDLSTDGDLVVAKILFQKLIELMDVKVFILNQEVKKCENWVEIIEKIEQEIKQMPSLFFKQVLEDKTAHYYLNLALFPIALAKIEIKKIDGGNFDKYSDLLHKMQSEDLYYSAPLLYKKANKLLAVFVLSDQVKTIMPIDPSTRMINTNLEVNDFFVAFFNFETKSQIGIISYQNFINHINQDNRFDDLNFIIEIDKGLMESLTHKFAVSIV